MKISYSKYLLAGKNSQPSQAGALLRVESDGFFGVADICPKPQFGDLALEDEMKVQGPLFQRALELATEDLQARKSGNSLLLNKAVANNILVTNYRLPEIVASRTYKIKADSDFDSLLEVCGKVPKARLDFNSSLSPAEFEKFLERLTPELKSRIEYIEDPTELNEKWKVWNRVIPLAFDFQKAAYSPELASYWIIKPSRQRVPALDSHVTLTSAMEHPVGVAHGLRLAQQLAHSVSGFSTLGLYEDCGFNRFFEQQGEFLNFSASAIGGTGIGMSDELEAQKWESA